MRSLEDRNKVPGTLDLSQETPHCSYKPNKCLSVIRDRNSKLVCFQRDPHEWLFIWWHIGSGKRKKRRRVVCLVLICVAVFLFPHFWILLIVPFFLSGHAQAVHATPWATLGLQQELGNVIIPTLSVFIMSVLIVFLSPTSSADREPLSYDAHRLSTNSG